MITQDSHIIHKQFIQVEFQNPDSAMGLQNRIAEVFHENIEPFMQALFDEQFGNYFASIDKLEIDCGLLNNKNWEQEFSDTLLRRLEEEVVQLNNKIDLDKMVETNAAETFFFFLNNGFLPWNKRVNSISELEQLVSINAKLVSQLKKLIERKPKVAERLVYSFSKIFTSKIIDEITKTRKDELDKIVSSPEKNNLLPGDKQIDSEEILKIFSSDAEVSEAIFINELQKVSDLKKGDNRIENEMVKEDDDKSANNIYINNCGLVLLHPFLQNLFEHLQFTEENKWKDKDLQCKATMVLEFLATGNDKFEEFDLVLNKILCGIEIDEVLTVNQEFNDEIKKECQVLLTDVITHWSVLKNTSIEGLRETFLQRNGKLSRVDNGWLLQVEQNAIDVLLGSLPWGIGTIKLPWMQEIIYVEWA